MAQAVSRWLLTADARVRARVSICGICSGQNGTGTGFFSEFFGFPCQYHSTIAPYSSAPHEVCESSDQAAHYHTFGPKLGASSLARHLAGTEVRIIILL
jgi:hypothetical protein